MTYDRKYMIRTIRCLRKKFKINKYNFAEILNCYNNFDFRANYYPKSWKRTFVSIVKKYQKQILKNKVRQYWKFAKDNKNGNYRRENNVY